MTTFNRESGRDRNGRQPSRAGTPWEERERKEKFLLNPHFKESARATRASQSPGQEWSHESGKTTK